MFVDWLDEEPHIYFLPKDNLSDGKSKIQQRRRVLTTYSNDGDNKVLENLFKKYIFSVKVPLNLEPVNFL